MFRRILVTVLVTTSAAHADRPASLADRDVQRYVTAHGLVTLCGAVFEGALQPGADGAGARCTVHGDFDADGTQDLAVLVAERRGKQRAGLLIKAGGKLTQFGAGSRTIWRFYNEQSFVRMPAPTDLEARASLREYAWGKEKPVQAKGTTLALSGGDATLAVFSDGVRWYAVHLGF